MRTRKKNTNTKIVSTHQVKQKLTIWHKVRGYLQGKRHLSRKQAKNSSNERNPPHMSELGANRNLIKQACKERAFPNKTGRSLDARQRHGTSLAGQWEWTLVCRPRPSWAGGLREALARSSASCSSWAPQTRGPGDHLPPAHAQDPA